MKKLIHLKSFQEFDPAEWELEDQDLNQSEESVQEKNIFDEPEDKWGRTSKTDKWGDDDKKSKSKKEVKVKEPKKPGRISTIKKDVKDQIWKGYKSELHPGFQKLRKYIKGKDSYFD